VPQSVAQVQAQLGDQAKRMMLPLLEQPCAPRQQVGCFCRHCRLLSLHRCYSTSPIARQQLHSRVCAHAALSMSTCLKMVYLPDIGMTLENLCMVW